MTEAEEAPAASPRASPINRSHTPTDSLLRQSSDFHKASEKGVDDTENFSGINGSHDNTVSDVDMNQSKSPESRRSNSGHRKESKSPIRGEGGINIKDGLKQRWASLDVSKQKSGE